MHACMRAHRFKVHGHDLEAGCLGVELRRLDEAQEEAADALAQALQHLRPSGRPPQQVVTRGRGAVQRGGWCCPLRCAGAGTACTHGDHMPT